MTISLLLSPEQQFCDANGIPYAGGAIGTYIPGTTTPKQTYADHLGAALNTNPVILDAAGRCLMFGDDGDYRLILHDASGNLIWDQWSTTLSSGLAAETAARQAADAAEITARQGADTALQNNLNAEVTRAVTADSTLTTNLNAEINRAQAAEATETARAEAEEAHLQSEIDALTSGGTGTATAGVRVGFATTDASGNITASFSPAFSFAVLYFTILGPGVTTYITVGPQPPNTPDAAATIINVTTIDLSGITLRVGLDTGTGPSGYVPYGAGISIGWWAVGA